MNKLIKNNKGSALLITMMVLAGALTAALGAANLVTPGIVMGRTQTQSTKAFFAAEAGAERALWKLRKDGFNGSHATCDPVLFVLRCMRINNNQCRVCTNNETKFTLSNGAIYQIQIDNTSGIVLYANGGYMDTKRKVEISY